MATLTRRRLFGLAAAGAGGLSVASLASTGTAEAAAAGSGADFVSGDLNLHLLRRATFGPTPSLRSSLKKQGRSKWLNKQLSPGFDRRFLLRSVGPWPVSTRQLEHSPSEKRA